MEKSIFYQPTHPKEEIIVTNDQTFVLFGNDLPNEQEIIFRLVKRGVKLNLLGFEARTEGEKILRIRLRHEAKDTVSRFDFRSLLQGNAQSTLYGMIAIEASAPGADAHFSHRTILLAGKAGESEPRVQTVPGLEIKADEVKAGHAATVGTIDAGDIYYLNSRGIADHAALKLLLEGFLQEKFLEIERNMQHKKNMRMIQNIIDSSIISFSL